MPSRQSDVRTEDCLALITSARVMTLGTAEQAEAWTAPVYYLFEAGAFYFFSSPRSRHIRQGESHGCGASIFQDAGEIASLKGVQMTGRIQTCTGVGKSLKIAAAFAAKYGITVSAGDALAYFAKGYRADLYGFFPLEIYYMDNSIGFGNREKIAL